MRPFADLSLRLRTRLALLGVLALFIAFGALALERMGALHQAATSIDQTAVPDLRLIGEIDILASAYRAAEADYLLAAPEDRAEGGEHLDRLRQRLDILLTQAATLEPVKGPLLDQAIALWPEYAARSAEVLALADAGRSSEAADAFRAAGQMHGALGTALESLLRAGEASLEEARLQIERAADQTRWLILSIGTGLMIVGLAVVLLFEASLAATAQRLLVAMRRVAAGDPNAPVPHTERDDEFGDLARAVRTFADALGVQRRREQELRAQVGTDALTGVANRRAFLERADDEISRALRYGHPLSLLMIDIDHFKKVNDTHGHAAGDSALVRMVEACKPSLREHDLLARLGGEEFVVLLPHTDAGRALLVAERLREAVEKAPVLTPAGLFHITISLGSATLDTRPSSDAPADSLSSLLERADKALYGAKHGGRNRVVASVRPAA